MKHRIRHEIASNPKDHIAIISNILHCKDPNDALDVLWDLAIDVNSTADEKDQAGYAFAMLAIGQNELSSGPLVMPSSPSSQVFSRFMEGKRNSSSSKERELALRIQDLREKYLRDRPEIQIKK